MKIETKDNLAVGDVMLLVREIGSAPETVNIDRLTKTQIQVRSAASPWRFKRKRCWMAPNKPSGAYEPVSRGWPTGGALLYDYSLETVKMLAKKHEACKQQSTEKKAERERRENENEERHRQELAEVKAVTNGVLALQWQETKPDGSRLYVFNLPINPQHADRKKEWETMIVHCWNAKRCDFDIDEREEADVIEYAVTYCNGSNGSFGSISISYAKTEEDALWEAARRQYHSW